MTILKIENLFVGTVSGDKYGYKRNLRVTIDVEIERTGRDAETIHHLPAEDPPRFSISGGVWNPNRTDYISYGQITDVLAELTTYAPGFDAGKAAKLAALWERWHLNDMRAGCVHQGEPAYRQGRYGPEVDLSSVPPCPETGYRYGSAWLVEELPEGFEAELRALLPQAES
jgi:hypothetical protein